MPTSRFLLCSAVSAVAVSSMCHAAQPDPAREAREYPSRPIRFIVPYAPGGSTDVIARLLGPRLTEAWGQPVIVDNRPGAGSTLGAKAVAASPPDGYTLMWGTLSSIAIAPALYKDPGYDPKAFVPAALVAAAGDEPVCPSAVLAARRGGGEVPQDQVK